MVFIYPAITSENVNRQIVPAACKSMELFFLYQIQASFNDGNIACVQDWNSGKHTYGPVRLESKNTSGNVVTEFKGFDALDNIKMIVTENKVVYQNNYKNPRVSANDSINEIVTESQNVEEKLHIYRIKLESAIADCKDSEFKNKLQSVYEQVCNDIKTEHEFRSNLTEAVVNGISIASNDDNEKKIEKLEKELEKAKKDNEKSKKAIDKLTDEKKIDRGSFKKAEDYKIDLTPTSIALDVPVYFRGGSLDDDGPRTKTITVGVKVVPIKIKNFSKVNDALMDDYFTKFSDNAFRGVSRSLGKAILGGFRKVLSRMPLVAKFLPDPAETYFDKQGDIVRKMITMAPSDFVNASAFTSNKDAPTNYKFTSSVVMFNKDDIEEDESIFSNRSAMNRLFKLGWTSFAVLDPVREVMLFISSLDGGFLHELPYSYMFSALNASDIYKNESALRNGTRPFSIRKGNFATFARSL